MWISSYYKSPTIIFFSEKKSEISTPKDSSFHVKIGHHIDRFVLIIMHRVLRIYHVFHSASILSGYSINFN